MATYGTIPTTSIESRGRSSLSTRRPWRDLINFQSFSIPQTLADSYLRIRSNSVYFAMNYTIIILLIIFLSLLWFPISLIVFVAMIAVWLFLYFLRDEPIVVMGRTISDLFVIVLLSVLTLVFLLLTGATANVLISVLVGVLVVLVHGLFRKSEENFVDEEGAGIGGWYKGVGDGSGVLQRS